MRRALYRLGFVLSVGMPATAHADVTVAVASNFRAPAEALALRYEEETGAEVRVILGSSGQHAARIVHGAPVDVFLSADEARPAALEAAGLVARRGTYAIGRLALYAPGHRDTADALNILKSGDFRRVALADPRVAPYGHAAEQAIAALGLDSVVENKRVIGENIGQTFGFVASGNAEIGFVAYSHVLAQPPERQQSHVLIDERLHDPISQDAVLLTRATDNDYATGFYEALFEPDAQALIVGFGYAVPPG